MRILVVYSDERKRSFDMNNSTIMNPFSGVIYQPARHRIMQDAHSTFDMMVLDHINDVRDMLVGRTYDVVLFRDRRGPELTLAQVEIRNAIRAMVLR